MKQLKPKALYQLENEGRRKLKILYLITALLVFSGCSDTSDEFEPDYGAPYSIVSSSESPKIVGDSLVVRLWWVGCGDDADYEFELKYDHSGNTYQLWLQKMIKESCRAEFETDMSFLIPDEVFLTKSIQLMKPDGDNIELR